MANGTSCEYCLNFVFDEEYACNICTVDMDMDELEALERSGFKGCAYYRVNNEYKIVEKQN